MKISGTKITGIGIYELSIPLKEPFVISLEKIMAAENIIVVMRTESGITGFGECSPFKSINGESQETCMVVGKLLAKALIRKEATDIEMNHIRMDKIIYGNSSIKSAFDLAMYDIAAQQAGQPLYQYLGGKKNKKLLTDYTISIGTPEKMAGDAMKIKEAGFKIIKVKLGEGSEIDISRIRAVREAVGKKIAIRIDANQGWDVATAIKCLKGLEQYNIQFCEEPIPRWAFMELKKVKQQSPIPIMADESCCDHHDAERLIKLKACSMFNLKLGKSSGLFKALKIIKLAEEAGMDMQVGSFMESRIAMTANAHLALSSKHILHCDFDGPMMFSEDPVSGGITYGEHGEIEVPDTPGLGAWIGEKELKKMSGWKC